MPYTAANLLVETLQQWGIDTLFGPRGSENNEIIEALDPAPAKLRAIWTHSAEAAALMACGYAKATGRIGVCLALSEPAAIRMLPGLYDARQDAQPVIVVTSQPEQQNPVFVPSFEHPYADAATISIRLSDPSEITQTVDLACRAALANSGVAHIHISPHLLSQPIEPAPAAPGVRSSSGGVPQRVRPSPEGDLRQAVEILNSGKKIVILVGRGALHATAEVTAMAEILGAPVVKTLMGKGVLPDGDAHSLGCMGPYGTLPAQRAVADCDTLLMVGSTFSYQTRQPKPMQARAIQIDADLTRIGLNYPIEVGIMGDSQRSLRDLLPQLQPNSDRSFLTVAQEEMRQWQEKTAQQLNNLSGLLKPQQVAWELGNALPPEALVASDPKRVCGWWARYLQVKQGQKHFTSGRLSLPGCGIAYAIAGQVAHPGRLCVALSSEAGLSAMLAEFALCASENLPVKVILFREYQSPSGVKDAINYALLAKGCGASSFTIAQPVECRPVLDEALASIGPALIEARWDPSEIPLAPEAVFG